MRDYTRTCHAAGGRSLPGSADIGYGAPLVSALSIWRPSGEGRRRVDSVSEAWPAPVRPGCGSFHGLKAQPGAAHRERIDGRRRRRGFTAVAAGASARAEDRVGSGIMTHARRRPVDPIHVENNGLSRVPSRPPIFQQWLPDPAEARATARAGVSRRRRAHAQGGQRTASPGGRFRQSMIFSMSDALVYEGVQPILDASNYRSAV